MALRGVLRIGLPALASATTCISGKRFKAKRACGGVTDKAGTPMPGVTVELATKSDGAHPLETKTDEGGQFQFGGAHAGEYELRVTAPGFGTRGNRLFSRNHRQKRISAKRRFALLWPQRGAVAL
jgi:hypothetical protein